MSILVSIAENIVVSNAVVNEKNSLEVTIQQGVVMDEFEAMSKGITVKPETAKMLFFPQDNKWYGKEATHEEMNMKFKQLTAKLAESIKLQASNISWNLFEGLGFTSAQDVKDNITKLEVAEKIGLNIYKQYAAMVAASDKSVFSRMKLVRQSSAKHFPTFPDVLFFKKDGDTWTVPFVESMVIPAAQTKLAYTKKEIEKGLHVADKVVADSVPSGDGDLPFQL